MRTFHTGGVAGEDITHGLPRVVELFEARTPKGAAVIAGISGVVRIGENEKGERVLTVIADDETEEPHIVTRRTHLFPGIADGVEVVAGQQLTGDQKTPIDPKKVLEVKGIRETQQYLSDEVQKVYREQGVSIHDKHIEVIVRQMLRRVGVSEPGDSKYLPGQQADAREFADINRRLVAEGKRPAEGRPVLMGITKASLATDSWLSAASFQETTRVLTEAAIEGRRDSLVGLKENVIIGKLIPAGTGMNRYRDIDTHAPDYEPLPFYSSDTDADGDLDLAAWLADTSATTLDEDVAAFAVVGAPPAEGELGDSTRCRDRRRGGGGPRLRARRRRVHAWKSAEATDDGRRRHRRPTTSGTPPLPDRRIARLAASVEQEFDCSTPAAGRRLLNGEHPPAARPRRPGGRRRPRPSSCSRSSGGRPSASSNIGFTSATSSASGASRTRSSSWIARAIDRYDRSRVTSSSTSGTRSVVRSPRFVRSRFTTRGFWRSSPRSCP